MKKAPIFTLILFLTLSLPSILTGCQGRTAAGFTISTEVATAFSTEAPSETSGFSEESFTEPSPGVEEGHPDVVPLYQFVKGQGIIRSSAPVFVLDADTPPQLTENDATAKLLSVIWRKQELYAEFKIEDCSAESTDAAQESLAEDEYITVDKNIRIPMHGYRKNEWGSAEDLVFNGPGIPEDICRPKNVTQSYSDHLLGEHGYIRYFICGLFETKPLDLQTDLTGYSFRIPEFNTPLEFSMKPAPGYDSLEALAAGQGGMDTHDGYSILATATAVEDGILIDLYTYNEKEKIMAVQITSPKENVPVLSQGGKTYPTKSIAPYAGVADYYRMDEVVPGTQNLQFLYDVPAAEQNASFTLTVPAVILPAAESSGHITLDIPEDSAELDMDIPFQDGTLRLQKITRMKKPREYRDMDQLGNVVSVEKPAVYLELSAQTSSEEKEIKNILCRRKADDAVWYTEKEWESQQIEFDEEQNIKGAYVFFEEGDTEITILFSNPWYYWNQPFVIPLKAGNL